ncbi:RNA polymerase II transcription elongation factor-domain-containing protein [Xylariaceae sp. FL1019]|nr:RNA polymerase II transcription elongation factor-domain-containing protein [Xylariaceae sp. FL1019]
MATPAGIVDPTKAGKYRVVLSDALLGKDSKELYTGIRYNHRPSLSTPTAPHQARIRPSGPSAPDSSYDLNFLDDGGRYTYQGTRGHEGNQYVLIFDPEREVFVLHHVDSMLNMNLTRTPTNSDAASLRQEHRQLDAHKPRPKPPASKPKKAAPKSAPSKKAPPPPKPAPKNNPPKDSDEESSDDDLLTIEDPGGAAPASNRDFSPAFIEKPRRFSEFVQQREEESEEGERDADGDDEDDDDDAFEHFTLPSPINRQLETSVHREADAPRAQHAQHEAQVEDGDEDEDEEMEAVGGAGAAGDADGDDDVDVDLEAELMAELEQDDDQGGDESDVSEEE